MKRKLYRIHKGKKSFAGYIHLELIEQTFLGMLYQYGGEPERLYD